MIISLGPPFLKGGRGTRGAAPPGRTPQSAKSPRQVEQVCTRDRTAQSAISYEL